MNIRVVDYDSHWPEMYEEEAKKIRAILKDELMDIHHIGSTAIGGIMAKPVIDIMPVVKDIDRIDKYDDDFIELGYEPRGELGIPGRRFYRKGIENRTHHVHIFDINSKYEIDRHLAFRDYMREHPDDADEYARLKVELATKYPDDIDSYCDGKEEYIRQIQRKSLSLYGTQTK